MANTITDDIPELYVLGDPVSSVVAFESKHPSIDVLKDGDAMSCRGRWRPRIWYGLVTT